MREMNSTGIVWCPSIQSDWEVRRVKDCFYISKVKAGTKNPVVLKLARCGVQVKDVTVNGGQMAESYDDYNPVQVGDLLLNPMDLYSGANCNVSEVEGVISPAYVNLRAKETLNPYYFDYYFKIQYWTMAMFAHGKGVSYDNRWTINAESVKAYELPFPSVSEQNAIVDIIKRKSTQIDALISNAQQQIEKLKAYKQSVITETVTKGLDPDVTMKDSGVEWIGEIPEDWEVTKFGRICKVKSNLVHPENYPDYIQIAPDNIEKGSGKLLPCQTVKESGVISDNHLFYKGQIIYSKIRPILNKVTIAPFDGLCSADMYPIETTQNYRYVLYYMLSNLFLIQVKMVTENRVKMPKINQEEISQIMTVFPSVEGQNEIVTFLDKKCTQIDSLIAIKQQKIEKLQKYKKSLIYEYVTGKKEV